MELTFEFLIISYLHNTELSCRRGLVAIFILNSGCSRFSSEIGGFSCYLRTIVAFSISSESSSALCLMLSTITSNDCCITFVRVNSTTWSVCIEKFAQVNSTNFFIKFINIDLVFNGLVESVWR